MKASILVPANVQLEFKRVNTLAFEVAHEGNVKWTTFFNMEGVLDDGIPFQYDTYYSRFRLFIGKLKVEAMVEDRYLNVVVNETNEGLEYVKLVWFSKGDTQLTLRLLDKVTSIEFEILITLVEGSEDTLILQWRLPI